MAWLMEVHVDAEAGYDNFVLIIERSIFRTPGLKQKKLVYKLFLFQNYVYFNFKINNALQYI